MWYAFLFPEISALRNANPLLTVQKELVLSSALPSSENKSFADRRIKKIDEVD